MPLAIFDIDGTLIDSTIIDTKCFLDAFHGEFGIDASTADPAEILNYTDRGLVIDLIRAFWSRAAEEADIARHRARYLMHLRRDATRLAEIAGARAFLRQLEEQGWTIALATGAWRESALLKLRLAGFDQDLPLASCDDFVSREEIVRSAIALGGNQWPVVLFGDGVWDLRCAANLGLPIVTVARDADAERLRRAGARVIIRDFAESSRAFSAIEEACRFTASTVAWTSGDLWT